MFSNPEQAFGGRSQMLSLVDHIYAAAQDASLWPSVLACISAAVSGESNLLFAGFPDLRTPDLYAAANVRQDAWDAYGAYYASINPIMAECEARFNPDTPWVSNHALSDSVLEKTEFYNDFFLKFQMHYTLGLRLVVDGIPPAAMSCQRSKSLGEYSAEEFLVFETLRPHLQRALQIHRRLSVLESQTSGLESALTALDQAVVGLDSRGCVCFSNRPAQKLFAVDDGFRLLGNRLRCTSIPEDESLQRAINCHVLALEELGIQNSSIRVSRSKSATPLLISFLPLRQAVAGAPTGLVALVMIADPASQSSRTQVLKALYGLTPSESRIADLLMQGLAIREISARLHITWETTRFQTKRILAKTGTKRQSELIRLLSVLPANTGQPA